MTHNKASAMEIERNIREMIGANILSSEKIIGHILVITNDKRKFLLGSAV
jgi:hypothetical protein